MEAIVSGLPASSIEYIKQSIEDVYGDSIISEVGLDELVVVLRQSVNDISKVAFVLDEITESKVKDKILDIGILGSDRYIQFSQSDKKLVEDLNRVIGSNLQVPVEEDISIPHEVEDFDEIVSPPPFEGTNSSLQEKLQTQKNQLKTKDQVIANLRLQLEEVMSFESDDILLRDEINELNSSQRTLKKEVESHVETISDLQSQLARLRKDRDANRKELNEVTARYQEQSSLLRDKTNQNDQLMKEAAKAEFLSEEIKEQRRKIRSLEDELVTAEAAKNEALRYRGEQHAKDLATSSNSAVKELNKTLKQLREDLEEVENDLTESHEELDESEAENRKLQQVIEENKETITQLNKELLERDEQSSGDIRQESEQINLLQKELYELKKSPFAAIAAQATPNGHDKISLIPRVTFQNISFLFSGASGSQRDLYSNLYEHLANGTGGFKFDPKKPILIVDAVAETTIDYSFQLRNVKTGMPWFAKGGKIAPYLSDTALPNVKVLSPGLNYINGFYLLDVDWGHRLNELENSGYNVVVIGGSLSENVPRVLFENFSETGHTQVVTVGLMTSIRNLILNFRGLRTGKNSDLVFLKFHPEARRYLSRLPATNSIYIDLEGNRQLVEI